MPTLCIAGKSQIGVDVLEHAVERRTWTVLALPNAGDNGIDDWQPSFRRAASRLDVRVASLEELYSITDLCFVSAEYDRLILPQRFTSSRLFNIHFSLLPKFRGCHTAIWPILHGEERHGVTLHWIDAGMDTGPIIAQRSFGLEGMTARDAYLRCMKDGTALVLKWLETLVAGEPPRQPQDEAGASSFSRLALDFGSKELTRHDRVEAVLRAFRAFTFPEYQRPTFKGRDVLQAAEEPQAILSAAVDEQWVGETEVLFATLDGTVRLTLAP